MYKAKRDYENLQKAMFSGKGQFDIPTIKPTTTDCRNWISFNFAKTCEEPGIHGVHFFLDDYQFVRTWNHPDRYVAMMQRFNTVCSPQFSTYTDFPKAIQIYNKYRSNWLGAYWQYHGANVIPSVTWADEASFEWCFDGDPVGGAVAVTSMGTQDSAYSKELFDKGYREMLDRLRPSQIIFYGDMPESVRGLADCEVIHLKSFSHIMRERTKR